MKIDSPINVPPPALQRMHWADTLKGLLIFLVVAGHFLSKLRNTDQLAHILYYTIYLFHMPAFAFVSGVLSRPDEPRWVRKHVISLVVPLMMLSPLFELGHFLINGKWSNYGSQWSPYWVLWFLLALLWWTAALPLFRRLPYALPLAIMLALLCGLVESVDKSFSLSRAIVFFPFFLAGNMWIASGRLRACMAKPARGWPFAVALAALAAAWVKILSPSKNLLFGNEGYEHMQLLPLQGMGLRLLVILSAFICIWGILQVVPRTENWLTRIGRNSVSVYILHAPLVAGFNQLWAPTVRQLQSPLGTIFLLGVAGVFTYILSRTWVRHSFDLVFARSIAWAQGALSPVAAKPENANSGPMPRRF